VADYGFGIIEARSWDLQPPISVIIHFCKFFPISNNPTPLLCILISSFPHWKNIYLLMKANIHKQRQEQRDLDLRLSMMDMKHSDGECQLNNGWKSPSMLKEDVLLGISSGWMSSKWLELTNKLSFYIENQSNKNPEHQEFKMITLYPINICQNNKI
jgi:hypothetical protein